MGLSVKNKLGKMILYGTVLFWSYRITTMSFMSALRPFKKRSYNISELLRAVSDRDYKQVEKLVKSGVNINSVDIDGVAPLELVLNDPDFMVFLISLGADLYYKDQFGRSLLNLAAEELASGTLNLEDWANLVWLLSHYEFPDLKAEMVARAYDIRQHAVHKGSAAAAAAVTPDSSSDSPKYVVITKVWPEKGYLSSILEPEP